MRDASSSSSSREPQGNTVVDETTYEAVSPRTQGIAGSIRIDVLSGAIKNAPFLEKKKKKEGSVRPSEQAYIDICLHPVDIIKRDIDIKNKSEVVFDSEREVTVTTFQYELLYKGQVCWRLKTRCTDNRAYSSATEITDEGQLIIKTFSKTKLSKYFVPKKKVITRFFDIPGIIQASAIAYHYRAVQVELDHSLKSSSVFDNPLMDINVDDDASVQVSELDISVIDEHSGRDGSCCTSTSGNNGVNRTRQVTTSQLSFEPITNNKLGVGLGFTAEQRETSVERDVGIGDQADEATREGHSSNGNGSILNAIQEQKKRYNNMYQGHLSS
jgi:hypothetical protein